MEFVQDVLDFFRAGFNQVNAVQGLIIALVAALLLPRLARLPMFVVAAALVHVIVDTLLPALSGSGEIALPPVLEQGFWRYAATLLAGYLVVIAILGLIKRVLLRR